MTSPLGFIALVGVPDPSDNEGFRMMPPYMFDERDENAVVKAVVESPPDWVMKHLRRGWVMLAREGNERGRVVAVAQVLRTRPVVLGFAHENHVRRYNTKLRTNDPMDEGDLMLPRIARVIRYEIDNYEHYTIRDKVESMGRSWSSFWHDPKVEPDLKIAAAAGAGMDPRQISAVIMAYMDLPQNHDPLLPYFGFMVAIWAWVRGPSWQVPTELVEMARSFSREMHAFRIGTIPPPLLPLWHLSEVIIDAASPSSSQRNQEIKKHAYLGLSTVDSVAKQNQREVLRKQIGLPQLLYAAMGWSP